MGGFVTNWLDNEIPVLTNLSISGTTETSVMLGYTVSGLTYPATVYSRVYPSTATPTDAEVLAGTGAVASASRSHGNGDREATVTGLSGGTGYKAYVVAVSSGSHDVSNVLGPITFTTTVVPSSDATLKSVAGQTISTTTGGVGTTANPYTAAVTVANSVSSIADTDLGVAPGATGGLVNSTFSATKDPTHLNVCK